jgi:hypothetical protein
VPIPSSVDVDRIIRKALVELSEAIDGWIRGVVLEEPALLSRIVERLKRESRTDYGLAAPVVVTKTTYVLHRQGPRGTDLHGADLAITVEFPPSGPTKTALFQLKLSSDQSARLERRQLEDARAHDAGWANSFVLAIDRERGTMRIKDMKSLLSDWVDGDTRAFEVSPWDGVSEWIPKWLACDVGTVSEVHDPKSLERALSRFVTPPDQPPWFFPGRGTPGETEAPLARTWLHFEFNLAEPRRGPRRTTRF